MPWISYPSRTIYAWQDVPSDKVPNDREMKSALVHRAWSCNRLVVAGSH